MFPNDREETMDLPRPFQAHTVVTQTLVADINTAVKMNHPRSIRDLARELRIQAKRENFLRRQHSTSSKAVGGMSQPHG